MRRVPLSSSLCCEEEQDNSGLIISHGLYLLQSFRFQPNKNGSWSQAWVLHGLEGCAVVSPNTMTELEPLPWTSLQHMKALGSLGPWPICNSSFSTHVHVVR